MATLSPLPRAIFFDQLGQPVTGMLYTYNAGTSTPRPTYTNSAGNVPNDNPLDLNGAQGTDVWFSGAYKIDVRDADDVSLPGYPVDNVVFYDPVDWSGLTATIADLNATDTSTLTKIADYPIVLSDRGKTILCDATSAGFTITLLAAATATNGYEITIKKIDVTKNIITITSSAGQTIEGRTSFLLYDQFDEITILCDGNNWRVKSGQIRGATILKSEAFTTTADDIGKTFICSATAPYAVTLVSAAIAGDGFRNTFKKSSDLNAITLTPAGVETIDGLSTYVLEDDYQSVTILSDGTNWYVETTVGLVTGVTGEVKYMVDITAPSGWVAYQGGTIGNAASGASARANADTLNLFTKLWNNIADQWAPVSNGRGVSALADFNANKTIKLPGTAGQTIGIAGSGSFNVTFTVDTANDLFNILNYPFIKTGTSFTVASTGTLPSPLVVATPYYAIRVSATTMRVALTYQDALDNVYVNLTTAGTGVLTFNVSYTARAPGESDGEETHLQAYAELVNHAHATGDAFGGEPGGAGAAVGTVNQVTTTSAVGGSQPFNIMQPTQFLNAYIKL